MEQTARYNTGGKHYGGSMQFDFLCGWAGCPPTGGGAGAAEQRLYRAGGRGGRAGGLHPAAYAARPGTLALGGRISEPVRKAAQAAGVELVDYFLRPELACLNAVPTAEGCLALLMQLRQRTIWESEFLVLGYGRIGRAVARRLQALGGQVTIAARAPEQRAAARCAGLHAAPLTALEQLLPHLDAVINTIPAPVLGAAQLRCLPRGALILDLASRPGGTDFAAARELGLRAEHALSLPARCAPETAGALVAHTVEVILQERAATARSERGVS